jgi:hypothetical protein
MRTYTSAHSTHSRVVVARAGSYTHTHLLADVVASLLNATKHGSLEVLGGTLVVGPHDVAAEPQLLP